MGKMCIDRYKLAALRDLARNEEFSKIAVINFF